MESPGSKLAFHGAGGQHRDAEATHYCLLDRLIAAELDRDAQVAQRRARLGQRFLQAAPGSGARLAQDEWLLAQFV